MLPTPPQHSTGRDTSWSSGQPRTPSSSAPSGRSSGRTVRYERRPVSDDVAKSAEAQKFRDYFEFSESLESMPSHRVLAVMRGEKEKVLALTFDGGDDDVYQAMIAQTLGIDMASTAAGDTVAGRHRRVRVAHQADDLRRGRRPHPAPATRGGGRRRGVRQEPQGPPARGARGYPHDARAWIPASGPA